MPQPPSVGARETPASTRRPSPPSQHRVTFTEQLLQELAEAGRRMVKSGSGPGLEKWPPASLRHAGPEGSRRRRSCTGAGARAGTRSSSSTSPPGALRSSNPSLCQRGLHVRTPWSGQCRTNNSQWPHEARPGTCPPAHPGADHRCRGRRTFQFGGKDRRRTPVPSPPQGKSTLHHYRTGPDRGIPCPPGTGPDRAHRHRGGTRRGKEELLDQDPPLRLHPLRTSPLRPQRRPASPGERMV